MNTLLVLQSDFGLVDGAVSAMIGVALEESATLKIHHLTHDITPYNIFEGSYRLFQTVNYWPEGTTFVSVVDPGVGSKRKSVVAKGPELSVDEIVEIPVVETTFGEGSVSGAIDILDVRFGSLWTSITREEFQELEPQFGERFEVTIYNNDMLVYQNQVTYGKSFADVRIGQPIIYINSLYRLGLAINQGSFAKAYNVGVGAQWHIEIKRIEN